MSETKAKDYCILCSFYAGKPTKIEAEKYPLTADDLTKILFGACTCARWTGIGYVCKKHAIEAEETKIRLIDTDIKYKLLDIEKLRKEKAQIEKRVEELKK